MAVNVPMEGGHAELRAWLIENDSLVDYIETVNCGDPTGQVPFSKKRKAVHSRMVRQLVDLITAIKAARSCLTSKERRRAKALPPPGVHTFHADQRRNLKIRALAFAQSALRDLRKQCVAASLEQLAVQLREAESFLGFFRTTVNVMPPDAAIGVSEPFFAVRRQPPAGLAFEAAALRRWIAGAEAEVATFERPPCVSNFPGFVDGILAVRGGTDEALAYRPPLSFEAALGQSIFCADSPIAGEIDAIVDIALAKQREEFLRRTIEFSVRALPAVDGRTELEKSIGSVMFFRIVFDRLYERQHHGIFFARQRKLMQLSHLPLRLFNCPLVVENPEDYELPVRDYFLRQDLFREAADFLNEMIYVNNPIDALYFMHRCIMAIHKAAMVQNTNEEVLCFDDLFALLVGVVLASDVPDFFEFAQFIERFTPHKCLSKPLDYAQVAISALVLHFDALDLDDLLQKKEATVSPGWGRLWRIGRRYAKRKKQLKCDQQCIKKLISKSE